MRPAPLAREQIDALVTTAHPVTGLTVPPVGTQPYYDWLVDALHRLAESSAGALRVWPDADDAASVFVAPGRATVGDTVLAYAGGVLDLAAFNHATALVWLDEDAGTARVAAGAAFDGWPATPHLKLAEATLAAGRVTAVLDRRFEAMLRA